MIDHGPAPYVIDIEKATVENTNYRTTVWTGSSLQLTVMAINPGDDIGLEVHADHDQFLRIESGTARVEMGPAENQLTFNRTVGADWAVFVPAGTWHNLTNVGDTPLQVYSIYAPPEHAPNTVHVTKADDDHHH